MCAYWRLALLHRGAIGNEDNERDHEAVDEQRHTKRATHALLRVLEEERNVGRRVRAKIRPTSCRSKSIPASLAIAGRCKPALVEPPAAATAVAAFSKDLRVTMSRGRSFSGTGHAAGGDRAGRRPSLDR